MKIITINKPGTYTVYTSVGHSPLSGAYTTTGKLYINDEVVYDILIRTNKAFSSGNITVFG